MRMRFSGRNIEGVKDTANFHLQESETELCFYLPKDEVDREVCFERPLPRRVMEYLKATNPSAESVFGTVFRNQNRTVVERILDEVGIAQVVVNELSEQDEDRNEQPDNLPQHQRLNMVPGEQHSTVSEVQPNEVPSEERRNITPGQQEEGNLRHQQQVNHVNPTRSQSPATPPREVGTLSASVTPNRPTLARSQSPATPSQGMRVPPAPVTPNRPTGLLTPPSSQIRQTVSSGQDASYRKILENVVAAARCKAADDMSLGRGSHSSSVSFLATISHELMQLGFGDRTGASDHDRKVGAAGGLYVCT